MTTTRNYEKEAKAVEIIANEIADNPANVPATHGTVHRSLGYTLRQSIATQMAGQFVKMLYKLEMADEPKDDQERMKIIKALVAAALEKTGK